MSGGKALFLILLFLAFFLHNEAALVVFAPTSHRAQLGENIVLQCSFKVDDSSINPQFLAILWMFQEKEVLRLDNKGISSHPRMFINKQDTSRGIANMEIRNVTISDIGKYRCMVIYSPQREIKDVDLTVYAIPSVVIQKMEKQDKTSFALCSVNGFYPRGITVEILKDGTVTEDSVMSEFHTNADGTYSVNMTWNIPSDVTPKMLSCLVNHETLTTKLQKDIQLLYANSNVSIIVAVLCGIVGALLIALIAIYYFKRKSGIQKFVVSAIEVPVWTDGEKTTLTCRASNCTKDVQVTWVIQDRDGNKYEVSDTVSGDKEEEQPLMLREYQVTKEKLNHRKEHHDVTTKLTFIPSISRHLGCTVTCRLTHQKNTEEKICEVKSIIAKPKFLEPVQFTLSGQGDVEISMKLQKFYPSEIEWRWFSKMGQSEKKIPSDNVISDSGNTFDLESKCSVPGELFKDPSNKVIMKWKHQSMEKSQIQEFSVRDLPWHPKLQTIPIESIFQDDQVLLQCRVSDYFPNILVVKWFERKTGSPDMVQISSSDKYKISEIYSYQMENQTFSSTTVLSYSRLDLSENGVEFTCRVEHPSLDTPLQSSIVQYRDAEVSALLMNNIQGPQTWYSGDKVTLYCTGSYCMEDTRVIWMVKEADGFICEITEDMRTDRDPPYGYVAHRERTDVSDVKGLLDVTSSLTFTPSIAKHQNISIHCKILYGGKGKVKTFQCKSLYAKPIVSSPIKLSLTDSGEVLCSLDIEGFYPRNIQIKWNDGEISEPNRTSQNSDGTFSVRSEHKLTGSFFSGSDSAVKVSWKHDSMKDWESRQMSVRDKEFPWKVNVQDIPVPNLLIDRAATLKCEVSNVFPNVLNVKWLKKEKDSEDVFPLIHSDTYNISEPRSEKQKDNTFTYKMCLRIKPSITDEGAEFICRVEHPTLEEPVEKSTGPLTIKDINTAAVPPPEDNQQQRLHQVSQTVSETDSDIAETAHEPIWIVGEIGGPSRWIHGEKVTVYCSVSYCSEDTNVKWMVKPTDGPAEEISSNGGDSRTDSGYLLSKDIEETDREGLVNITSLLTFIPSVSKHLGVIVSCTVSCNGQTETKEFIPRSFHAKPQILEGVKTSLCDTGDVLCSLNLQSFYPKHMKISWKSGENQLKSKQEYKENNDHTYNGHSHCTVPGNLLQDPKFTVHVTWGHKSLEKPQTEILSWRHPGLSWCPVMEEVPIPHVLSEQKNTLQYNISRYFPDAVTVSWYRKEKGEKEYKPLSHNEKYQIQDIQPQRQSDHTYSCTARLLFTPSVKDEDSEIMCTISHPSLERPIERRSGPLQVQAKPKVKKAMKLSLGIREVIFTQILEFFYPKDIQIKWCYWSGKKLEQYLPSEEKYKTNLNKTFTVTSVCKVPEDLLHNINFKVRVTWRHKSMDEAEYKEMSIKDKEFPWKPNLELSVPPLRIGEEATTYHKPRTHHIQCTVTKYLPDAVRVTWLRKNIQSGEMYPLSSDEIYRITDTPLGKQKDKLYGYNSSVTFSSSLERDDDVEYICRVEHPSLEQPIEKSTGDLYVSASQQQNPEQNDIDDLISQLDNKGI